MPASVAFPQSVDRIFTILQLLSGRAEGDSLASLARQARAPKSSVVSLLAGMVAAGYLVRDAVGRYRIGPVMAALAARIVSSQSLAGAVRPALERLVAATDETALAGVLSADGDRATYIEKIESRNPVRYTVSLGEHRELWCSAIGKLLLAHMSPERRDTYLRDHELVAFTPHTITSVRRLRAELRTVLAEGYAYTCDERVEGASAIAAPVLGADGTPVAGLVLAAPSERMRRHLARNVTALIAEARALGRAIGAPS